MTISASGLYAVTFIDILDASQITVDLSSGTLNKIALFTDTVTPDFAADTYYGTSPYNANETYGGSWAQGGYALTGSTCVAGGPSGAGLKYDANDVSQATCTVTNAKGGLIYYAGTQNYCVCLINFGGNYSTNNGTFGITFSGSGIFTIDLTP